MTPLRVFIVEDEPPARRAIRRLADAHPDCLVVGEAASADDALDRMRRVAVDLLLLDIGLPGMNGFDLLDRMPEARTPLVVFITAYDEHAIHAFEINAVDYLLKPFDDDRFGEAVRRARNRTRAGNVEPLSRQLRRGRDAVDVPGVPDGRDPGYQRRFAVRRGRHVRLIPADRVDWIEAADYYARLHVGTETHLVRETMSRLAAVLDPAEFIRVHRSAIVRIDRIRELARGNAGEWTIVLTTGAAVRVSRRYADPVRRAMAP